LYRRVLGLTLDDGGRAHRARAGGGRCASCRRGTLDLRAAWAGAWRALTTGLVTFTTIHNNRLRLGNTALENIIT